MRMPVPTIPPSLTASAPVPAPPSSCGGGYDEYKSDDQICIPYITFLSSERHAEKEKQRERDIDIEGDRKIEKSP